MTMGAALLAVALWPSWVSLWSTWSGGFSHGFVVAALVAFLLWRDRKGLMAKGGGMPGAVWLALGASLLWMLAVVLNVQVVHQALVPVLFLLWVATLGGLRVTRAAAPIAATFLLAVPLWDILSRPLQLVTIGANRLLLAVTGLNAVVRGETITIPWGTFLVAGSCSGLNYLLVALLVGAIYAHVFLRRWKNRLLVLGLAAGLAILGNWLRVFGLILLGYQSRMQSPLMDDHATYGWIVFAVTLIPFFLIAPLIEHRDRAWRQERRAEEERKSGTEAEPVAPRIVGVPSPARITLATGAALAGPVLYLVFILFPPPAVARTQVTGVASVESPGDGWVPALPEDSWVPAYQGWDSLATSAFTSPAGDRTVTVQRLIYLTQFQGKELVNDMNRLAAEDDLLTNRAVGPFPPRGRQFREAMVRTDQGVVLAWAWFHVAGRDTHSTTTAKVLELLGFVRRSPASELVVASTPCAAEDCREAARALADFVLGIELDIQ